MKRKHFGKSRYEVRPLLMEKYSLSEKDWDRLTQLWADYGMRAPGTDMTNRTPGNHYFLQGILEHLAIEFDSWEYKMSPVLIGILKEEFPQLMVNDFTFDIG